MGKEITKGHEHPLKLDFNSYKEFKERIHEGWNVNRITIIASPNKAVVVPCLPLADTDLTDLGKHHIAILATSSTTFKL